MTKTLYAALALVATAGAAAAECGGPFPDFLFGIQREAAARGLPEDATSAFLSGARQDPAVLRADRAQGVFQMRFTDFARRLISSNRRQNGAAQAAQWAETFDRIDSEHGVPRGVLLAFWGLETDFGAVQGDFNTRDALLTLAHDCRRPELFRPQVFAAIELTAHGDMDPATTTGAWAGEIGMVQMLPEDILTYGTDADGDGHVRLKTSPRDALTSGAKMLRGLGWQPNQPWLQEVRVPIDLNWAEAGLHAQKPVAEWAALGVAPTAGTLPDPGLQASLLLPEGRNGPAFLAYPNFRVFFEWNQSFVYVTTAAYFATRLEGAPVFNPGTPSPPLSQDQMKALQQALADRGHDVGGIDGILGQKTRAAVRAEQARLGHPPDAWPTVALLSAL
ncbi:MAG: lytic murein transglycosylase [Pseudomonadota bacterium]